MFWSDSILDILGYIYIIKINFIYIIFTFLMRLLEIFMYIGSFVAHILFIPRVKN